MQPDFAPPDVIEAIRAHAVACYPQEMCGAITPEGWEPLQNRHPDPKHHFDCAVDCAQLQASGRLLALVHSHPDGPEAPSEHDIGSQIHMDVPWGLVMCNDEAASEPYFWGDSLTPPPLEGRMFRHGPSGTDGRGDCGALVRDWYRLERGILIPDFARGDNWWNVPGQDLYEQHYREAGFTEVAIEAAEPGDVLLVQWRVPQDNLVANHGGIYLGHGLIFHHLCGRLSRQESVLGWRKFIRKALRHAG